MIATDAPTKRAFGRDASPFGIYPAFRSAFVLLPVRSWFDEAVCYAAPVCLDCGALCPADGMHRCERCRR